MVSVLNYGRDLMVFVIDGGICVLVMMIVVDCKGVVLMGVRKIVLSLYFWINLVSVWVFGKGKMVFVIVVEICVM